MLLHLLSTFLLSSLFGRPLAIRFALCYRTVVCPVCPLPSQPSVLTVTLVYCDQTVGRIKMPLGTQVALGPGQTVLDGKSASPKKGLSPLQFSAHACCGQTAGWTKMPLGTKVALCPDNIVLDGELAAPKKGHTPFNFRPMSVVANG